MPEMDSSAQVTSRVEQCEHGPETGCELSPHPGGALPRTGVIEIDFWDKSTNSGYRRAE